MPSPTAHPALAAVRDRAFPHDVGESPQARVPTAASSRGGNCQRGRELLAGPAPAWVLQGSLLGIFLLRFPPRAEAMAPVGRWPGAVLEPRTAPGCRGPEPCTGAWARTGYPSARDPSTHASAAGLLSAVSRVLSCKPDTVRGCFPSLGSAAYAVFLLLVYTLCT